MRFGFIDAEKATRPVRVLCRAQRVSPSGYDAWKRRPESRRSCEDRRLALLVREAHTLSRGSCVSPRVHAELRAEGARVSRKRVIRVIQVENLRHRTRRRFVRTTDSRATLVSVRIPATIGHGCR